MYGIGRFRYGLLPGVIVHGAEVLSGIKGHIHEFAAGGIHVHTQPLQGSGVAVGTGGEVETPVGQAEGDLEITW